MPETEAECLADVFFRILQDAAFVLAEPAEEPALAEGPLLVARIDFQSGRAGTLRLAAGPGAAEEIAANMLGIEPDEPDAVAQAPAALGELLNVVAGAFVMRLYGTATPSRLGLPAVDAAASFAPPDPSLAVAVRTDGGSPLVLALELDAG